jgi:Zn-dependent protease with chaperone function
MAETKIYEISLDLDHVTKKELFYKICRMDKELDDLGKELLDVQVARHFWKSWFLVFLVVAYIALCILLGWDQPLLYALYVLGTAAVSWLFIALWYGRYLVRFLLNLRELIAYSKPR